MLARGRRARALPQGCQESASSSNDVARSTTQHQGYGVSSVDRYGQRANAASIELDTESNNAASSTTPPAWGAQNRVQSRKAVMT